MKTLRFLTEILLVLAASGTILNQVKAVSPGVTMAASPQVALLDSANTREFFRRHYPPCSPPSSFLLGADEYQRYFRGWEFVLQQSPPIPYRIVGDSDMTMSVLSQYKVLILSNNASLSDDQVKAIHHWVNKGGRLAATFGSGYKDIDFDPHEDDLLKRHRGGTSGLHQLWKDPLSKLFSSSLVDPTGVDIRVTRYTGPTACLARELAADVLPYGADANMLIQRPEHHEDVLAFLQIDNWNRPAPAVILQRSSHGLVVYYAFAPEYLVSKEFGLPAPERCPDGQDWTGRSEKGRILMRCTIEYLLAN